MRTTWRILNIICFTFPSSLIVCIFLCGSLFRIPISSCHKYLSSYILVDLHFRSGYFLRFYKSLVLFLFTILHDVTTSKTPLAVPSTVRTSNLMKNLQSLLLSSALMTPLVAIFDTTLSASLSCFTPTPPTFSPQCR